MSLFDWAIIGAYLLVVCLIGWWATLSSNQCLGGGNTGARDRDNLHYS